MSFSHTRIKSIFVNFTYLPLKNVATLYDEKYYFHDIFIKNHNDMLLRVVISVQKNNSCDRFNNKLPLMIYHENLINIAFLLYHIFFEE